MKLRTRTIFFLLMMSLVFSHAQTKSELREAEIINLQKDMVAKLTGHMPIKGKKTLGSRASAAERKITVDFLLEEFKKIGLKAKKEFYNVKDNKGNMYSGTNVVMEIPATNGSDEYVVLGAHYDTAKGSPGAVHNATGVALIYFVAKELVKLPSRSINFLIVFFDQQENNMVGCRMFAKTMQDKKVKIHSMHRVDYMGWDNDEDRAIELLASNISLESLYRMESPVPIMKRTVSTPETRVFSTLGFDTITITAELKNGDNSPHVHQSSDTYTTVNFKYLASTTDIVYRVMKTMSR